MSGNEESSFYDQARVHRRYTEHRGQGYLSPNVVMEEPAVLGEIGDPTGLRVLDLGSGDGAFGRVLLAAGACSYLGIDSSHRMIEQANETLAGTAGRVELGDIALLEHEPASVDLVTARLSLHYVADLDRVVEAAAGRLVRGGRLIFTVIHPVITSYDNQPPGPRTTWTVDNYFDRGPRMRAWMGGQVLWHHRTVEDYVTAVIGAGLTLASLRECEPDEARLTGHPDELERRRRVPLFLLLNARADR